MSVGDRCSKSYRDGVKEFIKFAVRNICDETSPPISLSCPCVKCVNHVSLSVDEVELHLYRYGIDKNYTTWIKHGEADTNIPTNYVNNTGFADTDIPTNYDNVDTNIPTDACETVEMVNATKDNFKGDKKYQQFLQLLVDAEKPLYKGCLDFTKLSALVQLLNLKSKHGVSHKFVDELLKLLKKMLPADNEMVNNMYEGKRMMKAMGSGYEKIHVCINDCIIYYKDYKNLEACPVCNKSRWKVDEKTNKTYKNTPAKVLWYFPIIPRFKRLFQSKATAENLTWHATSTNKPGVLRHPSDSPAWKAIDDRYSDTIGSDPRNLRLGICTDGVDVHRGNRNHSVWPVLAVIYNLPPWMCMKRKFIMLSLLISGVPGNNIDVFLQPLIDDLAHLFEVGEPTYDAFKQEMFTLRAVVLWTINDYPALGTLCGCPYSGFKGCVVCRHDTQCVRLYHTRKQSYGDHRRYLSNDHPFRKQTKTFNGKEEMRTAKEPMTGEEIYDEVKNINNEWGKGSESLSGSKRKRDKTTPPPYWKKFNIWYQRLSYWKYLPVQHCIDLMHVEKNVAESIVGTLLNIPGRTKDGLAARKDLEFLGIKKELHPKAKGNNTELPAACFTLSAQEKDMFLETLYKLKAPLGYCSNFSSLVNLKERKLQGLKSHDYHMLMQQFLPLAIRSIMPEPMRNAIIRLCFFFKSICSKEIIVEELDKMQEEQIVTLCLLEKYFPPSFFDVMVHLTVHLVREIKLCGPPCFRWMYPFERCMKVIKGHVRNKTYPEGCIAEENIAEETIEFLSEYQKNIKSTVGIPHDKHDDDWETITVTGVKSVEVSVDLFKRAHFYVLQNTPEMAPYIE